MSEESHLDRRTTSYGTRWTVRSKIRHHSAQYVFMLLFGSFFGGIPLVMWVGIMFFDDDMSGWAKLGVSAFLSNFFLVGSIFISSGLLGLFGKMTVTLGPDAIAAGHRFGPFRWQKRVTFSQRDGFFKVLPATNQKSALAGVMRIVFHTADGESQPLLSGISEAAANELVAEIEQETGIRKGSTVEVAADPQDQISNRDHDVALNISGVVFPWKVMLVICMLLDSIIATIGLVLFFSGVDVPFPVWIVMGMTILIASGVLTFAIHRGMARMKLGPPTLTISVHPLLLGESFHLQFRQPVKSTGQCAGVIGTLVMEESARYRAGTDTHTVTHNAFEKEVEFVPPDSLSPGSDLTGEATFEIPTELMHTFSANNNHIKWMVKTKTKMPGWPDYGMNFECLVLPHAALDGQAGTGERS